MLPRLYGQARRNTACALEAYGERTAVDALPQTCPYTLDQITGDWLAEGVAHAELVITVATEPAMATRIKAGASDLYERDVYAWSKEQAALMRARRFTDLDLEHLIEEIEDVGGSLYREVRSRVRTIIEHLLKLEHSAAADPRAGWEKTIRTQRADLADDLTLSLRPRIEANLARFYETARIESATALRDHGEHAAANALPATCPYTLDQITGDWLPLR